MRLPPEIDYIKEQPKPISTTYGSYQYDTSNQYTNLNQYTNPMKNEVTLQKVFQENRATTSQHSFVQIGNMVEIVPRDLDVKTEIEDANNSKRMKTESLPLRVTHLEKSQIVQVRKIPFKVYF